MSTSFFNAWKVLDRVLTADRDRTAVDTAAYDRLQDRSLDALQRQVDALRARVEALEERYWDGRLRDERPSGVSRWVSGASVRSGSQRT